MLDVKGLSKSFGGLRAIDKVDFEVEEGQIFGIIGPNGAGKTTLFNMITGVVPPSDGAIIFRGTDLRGLKPYQIASLGVARTFQNIRLFNNMTVRENIIIGQYRKYSKSLAGFWGRLPENVHSEVDGLLNLLGLVEVEDCFVGELSYGYQRLVEIARALATQPKLLLLDEPAAGMNDIETKLLADNIVKIQKSGCTILIIEHDVDLMMGICGRIVVLNFGRKIAEGSASEVQENPFVVEAYLGQN